MYEGKESHSTSYEREEENIEMVSLRVANAHNFYGTCKPVILALIKMQWINGAEVAMDSFHSPSCALW